MSYLRKEKFLARTRIRERFWGFRKVDSNFTRLLIVKVSFEVPSSVIVRSLEQGPMSRLRDEDTLL